MHTASREDIDSACGEHIGDFVDLCEGFRDAVRTCFRLQVIATSSFAVPQIRGWRAQPAPSHLLDRARQPLLRRHALRDADSSTGFEISPRPIFRQQRHIFVINGVGEIVTALAGEVISYFASEQAADGTMPGRAALVRMRGLLSNFSVSRASRSACDPHITSAVRVGGGCG